MKPQKKVLSILATLLIKPFCLVTIILSIMLIACKKDINQEEKINLSEQLELDTVELISKQNISGKEAEFSCEEWYTVLNNDELLKFSLRESEEKQIDHILIEYQREYVEGDYTGEMIPKELVSRLEEALYEYCKFGEGGSDQLYRELLTELGGYRMTEEEIEQTFRGDANPYQAFTFMLKNGKRAYLRSFYFEKHRGADHSLWTESGGEWVREGDFMTLFEEGEVICYEDTYYYVGLEEHHELEENDRIRIFRLDEQMEWEDNLLIRYVPENYSRIPLSALAGEEDKQLKEYIEGLDEVLTLNKYVAGTDDELSVFLWRNRGAN